MQKRRWIFVVISVFFLVGMVLLSWAGGNRNDAAMTLVFIGYTNRLPLSTSGMPAITGRKLFLMPGQHIALLRAANTGSVPVEAHAAIWPDNAATIIHELPNGATSRLLKPGESLIVHVTVDPSDGPWSTELTYSRRGLREKLYEWTWNAKTPNILQRPLDLAFYPKFVRVKCGPITNQIPSEESAIAR
jgi:hypothetical protein